MKSEILKLIMNILKSDDIFTEIIYTVYILLIVKNLQALK